MNKIAAMFLSFPTNLKMFPIQAVRHTFHLNTVPMDPSARIPLWRQFDIAINKNVVLNSPVFTNDFLKDPCHVPSNPRKPLPWFGCEVKCGDCDTHTAVTLPVP
jgi:hypothetical protein